MSKLVLNGDTSGSVTLQAPAVSGSTVLTLPETSGTVLTTASGQWITTGSNIYYDTGNVGIGTTSPSSKLNVTGTSVVANIESTNNNNVMGILFNGSVGGYIGASASTLRFSNSSGTNVAAINSTNFQFNSGYGSVETAYGCRAWVNFNGTGTVAIRASGNVSSITDNGVGDYRVNFTNAMPDANYSVNSLTMRNSAAGVADPVIPCIYNSTTYGDAYTTSSVRIETIFNNGTGADPLSCNIAIFR